ncbi:hypothetical protein [Actinacidiphila sp. ITFR-21]|uniref:hypothetical protein n=1 Tax=Actinacidiphila sp. ITFR-21 TaxID=3075199 RepID=UPI00288B78FD|nr:hypothetical protein [Streptomyces sp. ITFR-21]WNI19125.1 hypothetical protein RLT57_28715 [Streptomyces sp. ITFR-21]
MATDYRTPAEKDAAERFPRDTAGFQVTVLHEQGLYRHLRFARRGGSYCEYWFDVITTPHTLIFRGDGESYVFSVHPTEDMFDLFRRTARPGEINAGYWSEKLTSKREAATDYSMDLFEQLVAEELAEAEKVWPGVTEAWTEHVESEFNTEYEPEARRALEDFEFGKTFTAKCSCGEESAPSTSYGAPLKWEREHSPTRSDDHKMSVEQDSFQFYDTYEWDVRDYDWWFLFACHGIRTVIARRDRLASYGLTSLATPKAVKAA